MLKELIMNNKVFSEEQAMEIGTTLGIDFTIIDIDQFRMGLSVELEHGSHDSETDVIHDDPSLAGKIAWAHLKEIPDYYTRLAQMESDAEA